VRSSRELKKRNRLVIGAKFTQYWPKLKSKIEDS
jgi:hypothetical protein